MQGWVGEGSQNNIYKQFSCATKILSDAQCCTCHLFPTLSLRSNFALTVRRFVCIHIKKIYIFDRCVFDFFFFVELGRNEELLWGSFWVMSIAAFIKWCHSNSITAECSGQREGLKGKLHFYTRPAQELLPVAPCWKLQELRAIQQEKPTRRKKKGKKGWKTECGGRDTKNHLNYLKCWKMFECLKNTGALLFYH